MSYTVYAIYFIFFYFITLTSHEETHNNFDV